MKNNISLIIILLALLLLSSCTNCYVSDGSLDAIKQKTTYKTFSQLNEPILIAMPQYENYYLFGNKNNNCKTEYAGDIIAIIDLETNEVYDWVFYPGRHGWSAWRLTETKNADGINYLYASVGTRSVAVISPNNTSLQIASTGIDDNFGLYKCYGNRVPQCYINNYFDGSGLNYKVCIFDVNQMEILENSYEFPFDSPPSITDMRCSPNENLWFFTVKNHIFHLNMIDMNTGIKKDSVYSFDSINERSKNYPEENGMDNFVVDYATDNYVLIGCYPLGVGCYGNYVYVYDINENNIKEIKIENGLYKQFIYDIQLVNDCFYAIVPNDLAENIPCEVNIYKLDIENCTSTKVTSIPFDMTDCTYVRGNRIYFMNSRSLSNPKYTYYDTETNETGPLFELSDARLIDEYLRMN